jgi:hypothetical protein
VKKYRQQSPTIANNRQQSPTIADSEGRLAEHTFGWGIRLLALMVTVPGFPFFILCLVLQAWCEYHTGSRGITFLGKVIFKR